MRGPPVFSRREIESYVQTEENGIGYGGRMLCWEIDLSTSRTKLCYPQGYSPVLMDHAKKEESGGVSSIGQTAFPKKAKS